MMLDCETSRDGMRYLGSLLLAACIPGQALAAPQTPAPKLEIELAPIADAKGAISTLDVKLRFDTPPSTGDLAAMAVSANTVETSANAIDGLTFSDTSGPLAVKAHDDARDGDNLERRWQPLRPVVGQVTVAYRVRIDPGQSELAKPQYELRAADGALSGAGNSFLVLPADEVARNVSVNWNLGQAGAGAKAASSLGPAASGRAVSSSHPLVPAEVASSYFMAGTIGAYAKDSFFGAWQGHFAFDGTELMDWASRLQSFYGDFFDQRPASFGVFARTNRLNPGSGIGLTDSFAFTFGDKTPIGDLESLLAHEMVHAFINSLDNSMDAAGGLSMSWFGEGLAVYYQRTLPYRAGLISRQAFLDDLNETAARYYTNALIGTPNDHIAEGFWKDTRVRVLPYDRGSLYFATVDSEIRRASGGLRSLDDLVRRMLAERRAGHPMNLALWRDLLRSELGENGLTEFEGMLAGKALSVPSNAFGPCFERVTKQLRRFDLGFDPLVLVSADRKVAGLKPESTAAAAGLRNGDRILNRFPQDALQGNQSATLTLEIERDGQQKTLTYLPRGEEVSAFQWQAKSCPANVK